MGAEFSDFVGCEQLIARLEGAVNGRGVFAHANLFLGPKGTGKRTLAEICARALNCTGSDKPCGECGSCSMYLSGNHPDHIVLKPEKGVIKVDTVRALIDRLAIKPYAGGRYTIVICQADQMNPQAQNALLKTLEEPPDSAVFFLTATHTAGLLPTILSRVRIVRFEPVSDRAVSEALRRRGIADGQIQKLLVSAQGCVGAALEQNGDEEYWALRQRVERALGEARSLASVESAASLLADDREQAARVIDIIEELAAHRMRCEVRGDSDARGPRYGARLLAAAFQARRMLASNVSWRSVLETLFFELLGGTK